MINKIYTDGNIQYQIKKEFLSKKPGHVVLKGFLDEGEYAKLREEIKNARREHVRVADRYSYGVIESKQVNEIFQSKEFKQFISKIINRDIKQISVMIREFAWRDYTLLHDAEDKKEEMRFFFFILPGGLEWDYFWGGSRVYHLERGKGKSLVFAPSENTLCVIHKRKDDLDFMQYINHYVGDKGVVVVEGTVE